MKSRALFPVKVLCGTILLCTLGPFAINLQLVSPVTLQSLIVILVPVMVGWQAGVSAILLYLVAGALGLPVLANFSSGLSPFTGTSAGFLLGFPLVGFLAGWWSTRVSPSYSSFLIVFLGCHVILLTFGTAGFLLAGLSVQLIASTLAQLLPGLFIKSILGGFLALHLRQGSRLQNRIAGTLRPLNPQP